MADASAGAMRHSITDQPQSSSIRFSPLRQFATIATQKITRHEQTLHFSRWEQIDRESIDKFEGRNVRPDNG